MIDSTYKQLKSNDEIFGGINIRKFGNLMHLPLFRGHQVSRAQATAEYFWRLFTTIHFVDNMRQQGNNYLDLMDKVSTNFKREFFIEKVLTIFPTRQQVQQYNEAVLKH